MMTARWQKAPGRHPGVLSRVVYPETIAARAARVRPPRPRPPDMWMVAAWIMNDVGNAVPDGDPIDWLAPRVRRHFGVDADVGRILDRAARQHLGVKSYTHYLHDMWEAYREAMNDYGGPYSTENPWPVK